MTNNNESNFFSKITDKFKNESQIEFISLTENKLIEVRILLVKIVKNITKHKLNEYADADFCKTDLEKFLSALVLETANVIAEYTELTDKQVIDLIIEIFTREL